MIVDIASCDLRNAVNRLNGMWATSHPSPIYTGILLEDDGEQLALSVANDTLWATTAVAITANQNEIGRVAVDAKQFSALARRLPDPMARLQQAGDTLTVKSGRMRAELSTMPADQFPGAPNRGEQILRLDSEQLGDIVSRVGMTAKKDGAFSVFSGVLLQADGKKLYAVATDSSRLAAMELSDAGIQGEWIIPADSLAQAVKAVGGGDVDMYASDTHICLASETATVYIQLFAGKFPDWQRVIPSGNTLRVAINRNALISALERAVLFEDKGMMAVELDISGDVMRVTGKNTYTSSRFAEEVACAANGERQQVFQARFVLDALKAMDGNDATFLFNAKEGLNPALIEEDGWQYVLMPVRSV